MARVDESRQYSTVPVATCALATCMLLAVTAVPALAQPDDPCVVEDDGTGTVELPPAGCAYLAPQEVFMIIDGLPPGTTIELIPILGAFVCRELGNCGTPGGDLGGEVEDFDMVSLFELHGTGDLAGFHRILALPSVAQTHTGPRNPGDPVQVFPTDMFVLQGSLAPGDPDFATLQLIAGTGFGLPSPGQTTLTRLGPRKPSIRPWCSSSRAPTPSATSVPPYAFPPAS